MPSDAKMNCRVCGRVQQEPLWGGDGKTPSFDICDCCGVEFGYEDATLGAVRRYRTEWVNKGGPWFVPDARPEQWDMDDQLRGVAEEFR